MIVPSEKQRDIRKERGVVTVELAILIPIIMMFILGILEFGHVWYVRHILTNAAREGARWGVVFRVDAAGNRVLKSETDIGNYIRDNYLGEMMTTYHVQVRTRYTDVNGGGIGTGDDLTVGLLADQNLTFAIGALITMAIGEEANVVRVGTSTTMRLE